MRYEYYVTYMHIVNNVVQYGNLAHTSLYKITDFDDVEELKEIIAKSLNSNSENVLILNYIFLRSYNTY